MNVKATYLQSVYWVQIDRGLSITAWGGGWVLCHNTCISCCHNNNKSNSLVKKLQRWCGTFFECFPYYHFTCDLLVCWTAARPAHHWFCFGADTKQMCVVQAWTSICCVIYQWLSYVGFFTVTVLDARSYRWNVSVLSSRAVVCSEGPNSIFDLDCVAFNVVLLATGCDGSVFALTHENQCPPNYIKHILTRGKKDTSV